MKFKALNNGYDFINEEDLLSTLLKNRKVDNPERLLNLDESVINDGLLLDNIENGLNLLNTYIKKSENEEINIHIIIDSDVDGICSSVVMYSYINDIKVKNNLKINLSYSLHKGKEHGIILNEIKNYNFDLLIVPDAGTNDIEACKFLSNNNKNILILDHHKIEQKNTYAIVINCTDGIYPNDTLSGTGVVYKFIKEFDKKYNYNFSNKYLDLVALGNIGDAMDLRNYETRYLTLQGLKSFGKNNLFLQELMEKQSNRLSNGITIMNVGWYIAPLLNAVVRVGSMEEKINVIKSLLGDKETKEYKPRKSKKNPNPQVEQQTLQKYMARECVNIKNRQDRQIKKGVEILQEKIKNKQLTNNKILIVDATDILDKNFTGLVANKIATEYKRPAIILKQKKDGLYGGSGRNYRLSPIISLRNLLLDLNTFNSVEGHDNAFGFSINTNALIETKEKSNEVLKNVPIEDVYKVDYEIPIGRLKEKHIKQVGQWDNIWGNTLDEPLFAITDIYLSTEDVKLLGQRKNVIKFEKNIGSNRITFIKLFANEDVYNKIILKSSKGLNKKTVQRIKLDIIGKFKINKWEGNEYPQIEIIDFNSEPNDEFVF